MAGARPGAHDSEELPSVIRSAAAYLLPNHMHPGRRQRAVDAPWLCCARALAAAARAVAACVLAAALACMRATMSAFSIVPVLCPLEAPTVTFFVSPSTSFCLRSVFWSRYD